MEEIEYKHPVILSKATVYIISFGENEAKIDSKEALKLWWDVNKVSDRNGLHVATFDKRTIMWYDDIDINQHGCTNEDYEKYFTESENDR